MRPIPLLLSGLLMTTALWAAEPTPPPTPPEPPVTAPRWTALGACTADVPNGRFCCTPGAVGFTDGPEAVVRIEALYLCGTDPQPRQARGQITVTLDASLPGVIDNHLCTVITDAECPDPITAMGWLGQLTIEQGDVVLQGYGERLF